MILNNVTKFPIVVIAPPRSGSSVICSQIGIDLKIRHINDITYAPDQNEVTKFLDFAKGTDQYVMKFHAYDIKKYPSWLTDRIYKGETYNVKVTRKNLVQHVASLYIASRRNLYHYDLVDLNNYHGLVEINYPKIHLAVEYIKKYTTELNALPVPFDEVVEYEDQLYDDHACVRTPLPSNYDEIIEEIRKII